MKNICKKFVVAVLLVCGVLLAKAQAPKHSIARDPYIGAITIDADSGKTLFEDRPDVPGYPASTLKLMLLLLVQERIEAGKLNLTDMVSVSVAAYKTGGSQVYLDPRGRFSDEDLLYATNIQSAVGA